MRCLDKDESKEQILLCKSLPFDIETGDTVKLGNSYVVVKGFSWRQCVDVGTGGGTTDGGRNARFVGARVTALGPEGIGNAARDAYVVNKIQALWKLYYVKLARFEAL
jgi:hypothetical protein